MYRNNAWIVNFGTGVIGALSVFYVFYAFAIPLPIVTIDRTAFAANQTIIDLQNTVASQQQTITKLNTELTNIRLVDYTEAICFAVFIIALVCFCSFLIWNNTKEKILELELKNKKG